MGTATHPAEAASGNGDTPDVGLAHTAGETACSFGLVHRTGETPL